MNRAALISLAGLALAAAAEACSVGLTGTSGWFIAGSAVAGASVYSTFSYLSPSGGVRAFALGRIVAGYASRVVLHSAALRRISAARLAFYDRAAKPEARGTWSGQSLDRIMADADCHGMALIQATAPTTDAAAMIVAGCLTTAGAGYPLTAALVAVSAAISAGLAIVVARRTDDTAQTRAGLRTGLVTAAVAWTEMASLDATEQLTVRALADLAVFEDRQTRQAAIQDRAGATGRVVTAVMIPLVILSAARAPAPALVFLVLLALGVMGSAERLIPAARARAVARQALSRLASAGHAQRQPPSPGPAFRATLGSRALTVTGYPLPATPTRAAREIAFTAAPGATVVVTGASGSGKTTLLDAIASSLRQQSGTVTSVLAEDYVFTGTIAGNIRLASPDAPDGYISDLLDVMLLAGLTPDTPVGTGGRDLSGGEQRRLCIARALATRPAVLLIG